LKEIVPLRSGHGSLSGLQPAKRQMIAARQHTKDLFILRE
jgi:hypothetical protein